MPPPPSFSGFLAFLTRFKPMQSGDGFHARLRVPSFVRSRFHLFIYVCERGRTDGRAPFHCRQPVSQVSRLSDSLTDWMSQTCEARKPFERCSVLEAERRKSGARRHSCLARAWFPHIVRTHTSSGFADCIAVKCLCKARWHGPATGSRSTCRAAPWARPCT